MNKDQFKGRGNEVAGKSKQAIGRATKNPRLMDEGAKQEFKGKVQKTAGDLKHKVGRAIDR